MRCGRFRFVAVLVAMAPWFPGTAGAGPDRSYTLPGDKDFFLQISAGPHGADLAVYTALLGAHRRLASPECRKIFSDFTDQDGLALQDKLEAAGATAQDFLGRLRYADGTGRAACNRGDVVAFTSVGGRIIYVCPRFKELFLAMRPRQREELEIGLIHEALHTLGLGENPPSSQEITRRVLTRCGDR